MIFHKRRKRVLLTIFLTGTIWLGCKTPSYREGHVLASPHGDIFVMHPYPLPNNYSGEVYWWLYKPKHMRTPEEKPILMHRYTLKDGQIMRYIVYWPSGFDCVYKSPNSVIARADSPCTEYLGDRNKLVYGFGEKGPLMSFEEFEIQEKPLNYIKKSN